MKEFRVRVYDDHYLVTDASIGVGTIIVEMGGLEEALTALGDLKECAKPAPKKKTSGPRNRRTKAQIAADKAAKAAADGTQDSATG